MGSHFIPQYYLKGFEDSTSPGDIWMLDKKLHTFKPVPIKTAAQRPKYFDKETERQLNEKVEAPAHALLRRVRSYHTFSQQERHIIAAYIAVMLYRIPAKRERSRVTIASEVLGDVINKTRSQIHDWGNSAGVDQQLVQIRLAELQRAEEKFQGQLPQEVITQIESPWPSINVLRIINAMPWYVLHTPRTDFFITSDSPVAYFEELGFAREKSEFVFPLASDIVLVGVWQGVREGTRFLIAPPPLVKEVNRRIAAKAHRFVFARRAADWIRILADKACPTFSRLRFM